MRSSLEPLSGALEALQTTAGWTLTIAFMTAVGQWAGVCLGRGELCTGGEFLTLAPLLFVAWIISPSMAGAWIVTALSWLLPLYNEGGWRKLAAASGVFLVWTGTMAWLIRGQ